MALLILSTGGTFEKVYRPDQGRLWFAESRLSHWAQQCRLPADARTEVLMLVDSLEMTDAQRDQIADAVAQAPEDQVVIIHGTDTMVNTAQSVMGRKRANQVVVFTGAMVPASQPDSDALFNLGMAVAAAQTMASGTYVCMSGQIFPAGQVQKNKALGRFEASLPDTE
ncbi:MAG: asparaginase domain-containing protein [Burkholderiaceae bacterium]|jgi:L-asparaginase